VAVLFGSGIGSSWEVMAISFVGRPRTRSFGGDSAGFSSANTSFRLSDDAVMVLTTAIDANRNGRTYGGALVLDEQVPGDQRRAGPVPGAAFAWLREQPTCR
jgi:hypothetical protein